MTLSTLLKGIFFILGMCPTWLATEVEYFNALQKVDFDEVKSDIIETLFDSKDFYPADYGFYGPFMIRMAWHCAGTIRISDGEGGCEGGRQRFEPERSWADNANLDKARKLLEPIKAKHGVGLSWGDLIIYTGTIALEYMGVPTIGFCAGRVDDDNGLESEVLGPSQYQEEISPCPIDGDCPGPLGTKLLEHIYVDPLGFKKDPDPAKSVGPIREAFARMGMNDTEILALIGGGHSFGKVHGGCPGGPGPSPKEDPENPWPFPNECGAKPSDKTTSGFEGPWSPRPTRFVNFYFNGLLNFEWELRNDSEGNHLFRMIEPSTFGPSADDPYEVAHALDNPIEEVMMLVTDMALVSDEVFLVEARKFATNFNEFKKQFSHAWYKLTTRDMGPVSRCFGDQVPEPQPFQGPLPLPFSEFPPISEVTELINQLRLSVKDDALIIETAYLCALTFRDTDHFGGCNGGRIFQEPERNWPERLPLMNSLQSIEDFKENFSHNISKADIAVLAGTLTLAQMMPETRRIEMSFCPFRSDALDEYQKISEMLRLQEYSDKLVQLKRQVRLLGLSIVEFTALQGRPRSSDYMKSLGYSGGFTLRNSNILSNNYATTLLSNTWRKSGMNGIFGEEYVNAENNLYVTHLDYILTIDSEFTYALMQLGGNDTFFLEIFSTGWMKLMNADRFDGPVENLCLNGRINPINTNQFFNKDEYRQESIDSSKTTIGVIFGLFICSFILMALVVVAINFKGTAKNESKIVNSFNANQISATL